MWVRKVRKDAGTVECADRVVILCAKVLAITQACVLDGLPVCVPDGLPVCTDQPRLTVQILWDTGLPAMGIPGLLPGGTIRDDIKVREMCVGVMRPS